MLDRDYAAALRAALGDAASTWRRRGRDFDLTKLLALPRGRQITLVQSSARFHSAEFVLTLHQVSYEQRFADPAMAHHLAHLAVLAARPAARAGSVIERDLLAESLATLGNACRVMGDTCRADQYLQEAKREFTLGSGDPLLATRIDRLVAVLKTDRAELGAARRLYTRCLRRYRRLGERELATQVLVSIARVHLQAGRSHQGLWCACRALEQIAPQRQRSVALSAMLLVAFARFQLGQFREVRGVTQTLQEICQLPEERVWFVRAQWIDARSELALGHWWEGMETLARIRSELVEIGALADAAHAHLDLALAFAETNRWDEAASVAGEAFGVLAAAGLEGPSLLALQTVARATEAGELSRQLLRRALGRVGATC